MRTPITTILLMAALAALIAAGMTNADAHPGHPQKKLFNARWYQTALDLSTSYADPSALTCEAGNYSACSAEWLPLINNSVADWNAQPDTAEFIVSGSFNANDDVVVRVFDQIFGDPNILGIAMTWDASNQSCPLPSCTTYRWGEAWIGDDGHAGFFNTNAVKQATITHEIGHLLSLRHESVNAGETVLYDCGMDDTGPIPQSIMSYDCIDPPAVGGAGLVAVQPWDVCGVNHAYFDAAFGYAGCPATPTPVITAPPNAFGNVDCDSGINSVDVLKVLRSGASLSVSQTEPCPDVATEMHSNGEVQGDVDCSNTVNAIDALKISRFAAGLSVVQDEPCPDIGS